MPYKLDTRTARRRLKARNSPYYVRIDRGVYLSYRRGPGQPTGRWGVRFYVGDKQYKESRFSSADDQDQAEGTTVQDFDQAREYARRLATKKKDDDRYDLTPATVDDVLDHYLEWFKEWRKSYATTKTTIEAHIRPKFGRRKVASLTKAEISKWHMSLVRAPARTRNKKITRELDTNDENAVRKRQSTANRILTVFKAALNRAVTDEKLHGDERKVWRDVEPFQNVDAPIERHLSVRESKRLYNAAAPDLRKLIRGALLCGARYGELITLRVQDYNPDTGKVFIRTSKSGKPRHIPLTDEGQNFYEEITAGRESDETLFLRADGSPWGKSHQTRPLRDAAAKAKLKGVSFHILRHTYGSLLAAEGVPLQVIAVALGHRSTRTTEKHYAHVKDDYVAEQIRKNLPTFSRQEPKVRQLK